MSKQVSRTTLKGELIIKILMAGRAEWNAFIAEYEEVDVDFSGVDFTEYRNDEDTLDFANYQFPKKGSVDFSKALFGEGDVSFYEAQFGEGDVSFYEAQFGEGDVSFYEAQFGKGEVDFIEAQFGKGEVDFRKAQFGKGHVSFLGAQFGEGHVQFNETQFGEGHVDFQEAQFGEGDVHFNAAELGEGDVDFCGIQFGKGNVGFCLTRFGKGDVNFCNARFGEGYVSFSGAQFGEGDVDFRDAQFGEGDVDFIETQFGRGNVSFQAITFKGRVSLRDLVSPEVITALSFQQSSFEKAMDISGNNFTCIPDFTRTFLKHQLVLDRMAWNNKEDTDAKTVRYNPERLCRLKELAENNKNHNQALRFHAQEMREKRPQLSGFDYWLDIAFDRVSEYGQSIAQPGKYLLLLITVYAAFYEIVSLIRNCSVQACAGASSLGNGLLYSMAQAFPFVSSSRISASESAASLFGEDIPNWIYMLSLSQGLLSFVCLFLIGLGLRNRFRL